MTAPYWRTLRLADVDRAGAGAGAAEESVEVMATYVGAITPLCEARFTEFF
ncbi:hypothetical protein HY17_01990 [Hyphomonas sp. CY54-11-8]|nr:hypothetical protein HY17_01990 [Hyphomonas sp. CY54-11-8]